MSRGAVVQAHGEVETRLCSVRVVSPPAMQVGPAALPCNYGCVRSCSSAGGACMRAPALHHAHSLRAGSAGGGRRAGRLGTGKSRWIRTWRWRQRWSSMTRLPVVWWPSNAVRCVCLRVCVCLCVFIDACMRVCERMRVCARTHVRV